MVKYIKCPRCELNYIDSEKQEYCDVCLAELQGSKLKFADLDEDDDLEKTELCPVCGVNYMRLSDKMCDECRKNSEYEEDEILEPDEDDEWRNYLDDDAEDLVLEEEPLGLPVELAAEFEDEKRNPKRSPTISTIWIFPTTIWTISTTMTMSPTKRTIFK